MRSEGQSREGTSSSYKVPIKTYQPIASVAALTAQPLAALPPYGCGVPLAGSERLAGWQYSGHVFYTRKADGLDYDPEDERQQHFLAEITKYNLRSID